MLGLAASVRNVKAKPLTLALKSFVAAKPRTTFGGISAGQRPVDL
jgi:hypothetical protein